MPVRRRRVIPSLVVALTTALAVIPSAGQAGTVPSATMRFRKPVYVSAGPRYQAAEPSIRVDASDENQRIWIAAPTGIGVDTRSLPAPDNGDLFWYSDDNGRTWELANAAAGVASPTIVGGGDSDVVTTVGDEVYGTGLTLANITLAASCNNGEVFTSNPISNIGSIEDRQWIDGYEDRRKPALGPELVLNYGGVAERRIWFHQVVAPGCAPPVAGPRIDTSHPDCLESINDPECYQWPGNLAVDERTGDVYVTHNTFGSEDAPFNDDVVVTRIDGGASGPVTQLDVHPFIAANDRPDTFDSFTVVAVDRASNVYVVWTERHPERQETWTMLAVSKDRGETWGAPIKVNRHPWTTTFPWIVAGDRGRIAIVYYGACARGSSPETLPKDAKWRVYTAISTNALRANPTFEEAPSTPFMHQGAICTSGLGCDPGTRDLLDFFQLDVDREGWVNIAYTDNLNTPKDPATTDEHQEWITFVQQAAGARLVA